MAMTDRAQKLSLSASTTRQSEMMDEAAASKTDSSEMFQIESYLTEPGWKHLLEDEFEKPYFKEMNRFLKSGYDKDLFRPPKELVFNALNSTKLEDVRTEDESPKQSARMIQEVDVLFR